MSLGRAYARKGAFTLRALRRACAAAFAIVTLASSLVRPVAAQSVTSDLFNPAPGGFNGQYDPLRKTADNGQGSTVENERKRKATEQPAPSRIGKIPTYGNPAASGAALTGYDSLGRKKKPASLPPGAPRKSIATGPGSFIPPPVEPDRPLPPSAKANKAPLPPAMAGAVAGQPPRRKLKVDDDPFGAAGFYAGPFLTKTAVELYGGYDSNPARVQNGPSSWFYKVAPELVMTSDWTRHSLIVDLRGSFTGYGHEFAAPPCDCVVPVASPIPSNLDRPDFTGKIDGRVDVTSDSRIDSELRLRLSTDNPGSPNIQTGLARYPIYTTVGGTLGGGQKFNRFELSGGATLDRTVYQQSLLTDGSLSSNADRDFNQYGGFVRASYELLPNVKPFVQVDTDVRVHDLNIDRAGFQRDSRGLTLRGGTTFELSRLVTGEVSIGEATRSYQDPRLERLSGLLTSASLVWTPTALSTVTLTADSAINESTLPGVPGVLTRDYGVQLDHAFRRWLVGTIKLGFGTSAYQGTLDRFDRRAYAEGDLVYKLTRTVQVKASVRQEWLRSNVAGADTDATVVMLGMRFQR